MFYHWSPDPVLHKDSFDQSSTYILSKYLICKNLKKSLHTTNLFYVLYRCIMKNCFFIIFHTLVALKLLVLPISRLVACSAKIVVDTQTDTQTKYCNHCCACAPAEG